VKQHNQKRRNVHALGLPTAANMLELTWSERLASEAWSLSSTCVFAHKTNGYGQNLFLSTRGSPDSITITRALEAWVDDELPSSFVSILNGQGAEIGSGSYNHASQVLWATSGQIGCGYTQCPSGFFLVCNYSPAGNYVGSPWYQPGTACSACPASASRCNDGLCSTPEVSLTPPSISVTPVPPSTYTLETKIPPPSPPAKPPLMPTHMVEQNTIFINSLEQNNVEKLTADENYTPEKATTMPSTSSTVSYSMLKVTPFLTFIFWAWTVFYI
jgi:hypothetical protein